MAHRTAPCLPNCLYLGELISLTISTFSFSSTAAASRRRLSRADGRFVTRHGRLRATVGISVLPTSASGRCGERLYLARAYLRHHVLMASNIISTLTAEQRNARLVAALVRHVHDVHAAMDLNSSPAMWYGVPGPEEA